MASRQESLCWTRSEIVSKSSLGIPLAKASNSSRIRALGVQNTRLESLRNQPEIVPKASNRSRIRGKCVRNTSHKNYRTLPLESIKNKQLYSPSTSQETVRLPVIAPKSSRNLALENGSERLKQVRSSGIAPTSSRNLALENGSESLEQQQDSCPRHAKHKPEKLSKRRRRNPIKGKKKDSLQALRHRKKHFYYITLVWNRAEIISKFGLGKQFRKPRTAAGFVPKACKTQANKTLETSPTEPT